MSEPLGYYPLSSDIFQNDRKLRVVLTGPQRPLVDVNLVDEWHRRLGATGLHYDPVEHAIIADLGHLLCTRPAKAAGTAVDCVEKI